MATDEGLDDVLTNIGYGLWQLPVLVLSILTHLVIPVHMIGSVLLSAPVAFKCSHSSSIVQSPNNISTLSVLSPNVNEINITDSGHMASLTYDSKCLDPETASLQYGLQGEAGSIEIKGRSTDLPSCPWVFYDNSVFVSTVISEWDLICEKEMLRPLFQMMYSIGALFGSIIGGQVSDSFGRKRAVQIASFINLSAVVVLYVMPWYTGALVARIFLGGSCNFMVVPAYGLALEISPPKHRTLVGMLLGTAFSTGIIILAGLGYFIRSWKLLMLLDAVIPFVFLIPLSFWIIESPRWLIQHGRSAEAARIMTHAIKVNKVVLSQPLADAIDELKEKPEITSTGNSEKTPRASVWTCCKSLCEGASVYLRSGALRVIMLISPLIWLLQGCLYLGIILNANNFTSNNPFVYITVSGVMDLSSILLATPLSVKLGRRVIIAGSFFIGGILLMIDIFVPTSLLWLKFILVMTALMLVAASFQVNFLYTSELYPTIIRARGFSISILFGNVGFLVAPLITDLLSSLVWWSVSVTFGCAGLVASFLVPLLPETLHRPLPETVLDVEKRHRKRRLSKKEKGKEKEKLEDVSEVDKDECEALNPS